MSGMTGRDLAYDGRQPYKPTRGARKPRNLDAMTAAYAANDETAIRHEIDVYAEQLRQEGAHW